MIFDTDIFIWVQRGRLRAARAMDQEKERYLSVQTYLELLQSAQNKNQTLLIKQFIYDMEFSVLPLTENVGHRAIIYIEEYGLSSGIRAGDAIIAATAVENNMPLMTSNAKHFKGIRDLQLKVFAPS